jgi:hypothetical protein
MFLNINRIKISCALLKRKIVVDGWKYFEELGSNLYMLHKILTFEEE